MYEAYFNLQRRPFSATPVAGCFFAPDAIQEHLDQLVLRAQAGEGIGVVTGGAGTGKTLLCRRVAAELVPQMTPVFLANANFPTRRALLQTILFELGRKYSGLPEQELWLATFGTLRELAVAGRGAALIVDEAHLLSDRLLEELRLLACLSEEGQPLTRLILAGQPALEERLTSLRHEALNQRIVCQLNLEPLTRRESIDYIEFRMAWAGGHAVPLFDDSALDSIATAAVGVPRCLNQLCDHALLLAFVQERTQVTAAIVAEALDDLRQLPLHWNTTLSAEVPLTSREEDAEFGADGGLDNASEQGIVAEGGVPDTTSGSFGADTVCFEIGGVDEEIEPADDYSESISLADELGPTFAAAPAVIPPIQVIPQKFSGLTIEPLVDRYAMLDAKMPRLVRTFEDAPAPTNWQPAKCSDVPPAPEPPALTELPELSVESSLEDDSQFEEDIESDAVLEPVAEESLDDEFPVNLLVDRVEPAIEDQLQASVLEACREVESAIGRWHEEEISSPIRPDRRLQDSRLDKEAVDDIVLPEPDRDYDVIEPATPVNLRLDREIVRHERAPLAPATAHDVPQPKYRLVFSTLRRRLGRGR